MFQFDGTGLQAKKLIEDYLADETFLKGGGEDIRIKLIDYAKKLCLLMTDNSASADEYLKMCGVEECTECFIVGERSHVTDVELNLIADLYNTEVEYFGYDGVVGQHFAVVDFSGGTASYILVEHILFEQPCWKLIHID